MYIGPPRSEQEFQKYLELRWRILRAPWNQPRGSECDDHESAARHMLVCDERSQVLAVGRMHLNSAEEAQIRYMATEPAHRRQGWGARIVAELEEWARRDGAQWAVLNARSEALTFYERLGYCVVGKGPTMFDSVRHSRMKKSL